MHLWPAHLKCCTCHRDRAEERRRGINPDYEDVQAQMATLATGNMQMQQGLGNISVENSKFLGGDLTLKTAGSEQLIGFDDIAE